MATLLVIADDYTGAMDTGVQFIKGGASVLVSPDPEGAFSRLSPDTDVLALDLEMRHDEPGTAAEKVRRAVAQGVRSGIPYIYIKTDSTLRGNIGAVLETALKESRNTVLPFIPAYPKTGRTTQNGIHYVNGVPLADTVFSRDPLNPVRHSDIKSIIAEQSNLPVKIVSRGGGLADDTFPSIWAFDACEDADLNNAARRLSDSGRLVITAGCGGFAEALREFIPLPKRPRRKFGAGGRVLIISGSVNEASIHQLHLAEEVGFKGLSLAEEPIDPTDPPAAVLFADKAAELLNRSGKAIVASVFSREQIRRDIKQSPARTLGAIAGLILKRTQADALVVFGGDTLIETMRGIGCAGLMPAAEIVPGIVAAHPDGGSFGGTVITKAGGFGPPDAVAQIMRFLESQQEI